MYAFMLNLFGLLLACTHTTGQRRLAVEGESLQYLRGTELLLLWKELERSAPAKLRWV